MKTLTEFGDRIVTLCNGQQGLRGGVHIEARAPGDLPAEQQGQPIIDFVSSDDTLDRYDETIVASGWKLDNYKKNAVFQNCHKYGDVLFTLGKALITEVRGNALFQRVLFATEINPVAKIAYGLYRGKFLNAVSVGFVPIRWETGNQEAPYSRKYLEQELLETSAVGIPANPNALQMGLKSGAIEKSDLLDVVDFIKQLCSTPAGSDTDTRALGAGADEAQVLQLAREFNEVLNRA